MTGNSSHTFIAIGGGERGIISECTDRSAETFATRDGEMADNLVMTVSEQRMSHQTKGAIGGPGRIGLIPYRYKDSLRVSSRPAYVGLRKTGKGILVKRVDRWTRGSSITKDGQRRRDRTDFGKVCLFNVHNVALGIEIKLYSWESRSTTSPTRPWPRYRRQPRCRRIMVPAQWAICVDLSLEVGVSPSGKMTGHRKPVIEEGPGGACDPVGEQQLTLDPLLDLFPIVPREPDTSLKQQTWSMVAEHIARRSAEEEMYEIRVLTGIASSSIQRDP
uniref:Uncharacterized protein n=1 Tax=Bracon brevicornis TaxID=1563983 RepID=A0A6V7KUW5_9HYME